MKFYMVYIDEDYEYHDPRGFYSTLEKAKERIKKDFHRDTTLNIYEIELDKDIDYISDLKLIQ